MTALWAAVQKRKAGHNFKRLIIGFSGLNGLPIIHHLIQHIKPDDFARLWKTGVFGRSRKDDLNLGY